RKRIEVAFVAPGGLKVRGNGRLLGRKPRVSTPAHLHEKIRDAARRRILHRLLNAGSRGEGVAHNPERPNRLWWDRGSRCGIALGVWPATPEKEPGKDKSGRPVSHLLHIYRVIVQKGCFFQHVLEGGQKV